MCKRETESVCESVSERERDSVCESVSERERDSVCVRVCVCGMCVCA